MSISATSAAALACLAMLVQAPVNAGQTPPNPPHQHQQDPKPSANMSAKCQAMMAEHEKMMADMKAADQRLDELVATMTAASGQAKVDATAAVVSELVAQRKAMREGMIKKHGGMKH